MVKKLIALLLFVNCSVIYAQTVKTDVLVIGGSASGVMAALQCAHSKVKTIIALPDSIPGLADTVKNLIIYYKSPFTSVKKDGDYWLANIKHSGKNIAIRARVIVDATESGEVLLKAGAKIPPAFTAVNYRPNSYRTTVTTGEWIPKQNADAIKENYPPYPVYYIPIRAYILSDVDNIVVTEKILPDDKNMRYPQLQAALGQGAGVIAAYCAFFKTTTKNLKVRAIQGELLDFKGSLLPFADILPDNRNWRAVQQVGATGLLKGIQKIDGKNMSFLFEPDLTVNTSEIRLILTEIYTRAFLWFNKEKPGEQFTIGNTLSLISDYTLTDPTVLQSAIQKAWKTQYQFTKDFNLKRPITRLEFAVLINRYLNPFARTVDLDGRFMN